MKVNGRKVHKRITEDNIVAALPAGYKLIRINWKKGKIHIANGFGEKKYISLNTLQS